MTSDIDTIAKLTAQRDLLRKGNETICEINGYWIGRCVEAEREVRRLRDRMKRLTKKVKEFTSERSK